MSSGIPLIAVSRAVGIAREFSVVFLIGFTAATDAYYIAIFPLFALLAMFSGPFTTAFTARLGHASKSRRNLHLLYYRRRMLAFGAIMAFGYLAFAAGAWLISKEQLASAIAILIPAAFFLMLQGYFLAELSAHGRIAEGAAVQLVMNILFVTILVTGWNFGFSQSPVILPLGYLLSNMVALLLSYRLVQRNIYPDRGNLDGKPVPLDKLGSSMGFAGAESIVYLGTQGLIVGLASAIGGGWVSAASLAQRISFSVVGLVISPLTTLMMIAIMENRENSRKVAGRYLFGAISFLSLFAAGIAVVSANLPQIAPDLLNSNEARLVFAVLPAYAVWLIAVGLNGTISRISFASSRERFYTIATILSYLMANIGRLIMFANDGNLFSIIVAGALVELVFIGLLTRWIFASVLNQNSRKSDSFPRQASAKATSQKDG